MKYFIGFIFGISTAIAVAGPSVEQRLAELEKTVALLKSERDEFVATGCTPRGFMRGFRGCKK